MWKKAEKFFLYHNHLSELERYRGRSFLLLTLLFFLLQCIAGHLWYFSQPENQRFHAVALLALAVLLLPLWVLRKTQNIKKTCQALLLGHFLLYSVMIAITGLYHSPLASSLFYLPLIALLSGDAKLSLRCALYCLLAFMIALVVSQLEWHFSVLNSAQHEFWYQWSIFNAVVISGFLAMAYNRTLTIMASRLQQQRQAFEQETFTDNLTALANLQQLKKALKKHPKNQQPLLLLVVDVVDFKAINNRYGHHTGDQVLQALGQRLQACVSHKDLVARVGGDQFVVVLAGLASEQEQQNLQEAMAKRLGDVFYTHKHRVFLNCRLYGLKLEPDDTIDALLQGLKRQKGEVAC